MLLGDSVRWPDLEIRVDDDAVDRAILVAVEREGRTTLLGRGDPAAAVRLAGDWLAAHSRAGRAPMVGWMSLPRGVTVPESVLDRVALAPVSAWDWMVTGRAPVVAGAAETVVRLDPRADGDAIRDCLAVANPGTTADPSGPGEAGWFGVRDGDALVGVMGATWRGGPAGGAFSWHLHGLGVVPHARGRGLGGALTAAVTMAGFEAGASWVSLGLYADNLRARRIYTGLGFAVEGEFRSFGPLGQDAAAQRRRPA
jgi:ribosomal protein S18 acetylase RimI-like enzyme